VLFEHLSIFGQLELDMSEKVTLIAGVRWSDDDKDIDFTATYEELDVGIPLSQVFDISQVSIDGIGEIGYDDFAARLQINYAVDDDTLIFASWNRGIKGGNWSIDPLGTVAFLDPQNLKHDEEVLLSYEFGLKTDLSDWARLNTSIYFYDYDDYQAFSLLGLTPQVTNSDAKSHGGEIELILNPVENFDLLLGLAYIDSEVDAVPDVFGGTVKAEFPNAPSMSVNFLARYACDISGGTVATQIDGNWNDDQFVEASNSELSFEDSYMLWNARLSYTAPSGDWTVQGWIKNVGDEKYRMYNLDLGLLGIAEEVYAPPRWWGITARYSF
jgi:iron complex outermembrane receptor protein